MLIILQILHNSELENVYKRISYLEGIVLSTITSELKEARGKAVFDRVEELKSCKSELFDEIFQKDVANKK